MGKEGKDRKGKERKNTYEGRRKKERKKERDLGV